MILKKWQDLPIFVRNQETKKYYDILKKKKNTRILNNYLGMALISVVVVLLLGVLTVQSNELKAKISSYDTRAAEIRTSIEEEQDRTKQIDEEKEYMQTDEYVAEIARDRLGLVKSNEIVFEEEK